MRLPFTNLGIFETPQCDVSTIREYKDGLKAPNDPIFGALLRKKNHVTEREKSHHDGNFFSSWSEHPSLHGEIFFLRDGFSTTSPKA